MSPFELLVTEQNARAVMQDKINALYAEGQLQQSDIQFIADDAHKPYPQYVGYFNPAKGWKLAVVTRDVKTKMGIAFKAGDIVIAQPSAMPSIFSDKKVYSVRNRCETIVDYGVKFLDA